VAKSAILIRFVEGDLFRKWGRIVLPKELNSRSDEPSRFAKTITGVLSMPLKPMARGFRLDMVNSIFPNQTTNRNQGPALL
jgi:hypothetical protein